MPSTGAGPVFGDYRCNVCENWARSIEIESEYDDIFSWQVSSPAKMIKAHWVHFGPCGCIMKTHDKYVIRTWQEAEEVSW